MAEEMGERTEQPTGKKLGDAREKGQVARSQDLAAAVELSAVLITLIVLGGWLANQLGRLVLQALDTGLSQALMDMRTLQPLLVSALLQMLMALGPFFVIFMVMAYIAHVMQFGFLWTTKPFEPDITKFNPISGFKRVFGLRGQVKTLLGGLKMIAVLVVATLFMLRSLPKIAALPTLSAGGAVMAMLRLCAELLIVLLVIILIIGFADFLYQRWQHIKDLRMTKQEVTDERKSMDGDPAMKGKRQRMAREIALQRVGQDVPKADVVVTNPTHFAVALQYDQTAMKAPKVIAKGADFLALRIRQVATASGVQIVERPPLARALYFGVDVGREVRPEHYEAVAEVLAYVYKLEKQAA
jgi:flagellar biosynthesis protein FlhB